MPGGYFQVLEGRHEEGIGADKKVYTKGQKFESEKDLDELFANKFKRIDGEQKRQRDRDDSLDSSGRILDDELSEKRRKVKKKKPSEMTVEEVREQRKERGFAAKSASGQRARGETPPEDEVDEEEEEEEDLDEEEEDEEEEEEAPKKSSKNKSVAKKSAKDEEEEEEEEEQKPDFGKDVTAQFSKAEDDNLTVFKGANGFVVVDPDRPTVQMNKEELPAKKDVNKFLTDRHKKPTKKAKK